MIKTNDVTVFMLVMGCCLELYEAFKFLLMYLNPYHVVVLYENNLYILTFELITCSILGVIGIYALRNEYNEGKPVAKS